jgi:hypothetical protein
MFIPLLALLLISLILIIHLELLLIDQQTARVERIPI